MKSKCSNRASNRTKARIKDAFAALLEEKKELKKITVTDIVKLVDIDRSTFYAYFDDIFAIAEDFEQDAILTFFDNLSMSSFEYRDYFHQLFSYLTENEKMYRIFVSCKEPMYFMDMLRKRENAVLLDYCKTISRSRTLVPDIEFFTYGLINMCIDYYQGKTTCSLIELEKKSVEWFEEIVIK